MIPSAAEPSATTTPPPGQAGPDALQGARVAVADPRAVKLVTQVADQPSPTVGAESPELRDVLLKEYGKGDKGLYLAVVRTEDGAPVYRLYHSNTTVSGMNLQPSWVGEEMRSGKGPDAGRELAAKVEATAKAFGEARTAVESKIQGWAVDANGANVFLAQDGRYFNSAWLVSNGDALAQYRTLAEELGRRPEPAVQPPIAVESTLANAKAEPILPSSKEAYAVFEKAAQRGFSVVLTGVDNATHTQTYWVRRHVVDATGATTTQYIGGPVKVPYGEGQAPSVRDTALKDALSEHLEHPPIEIRPGGRGGIPVPIDRVGAKELFDATNKAISEGRVAGICVLGTPYGDGNAGLVQYAFFNAQGYIVGQPVSVAYDNAGQFHSLRNQGLMRELSQITQEQRSGVSERVSFTVESRVPGLPNVTLSAPLSDEKAVQAVRTLQSLQQQGYHVVIPEGADRNGGAWGFGLEQFHGSPPGYHGIYDRFETVGWKTRVSDPALMNDPSALLQVVADRLSATARVSQLGYEGFVTDYSPTHEFAVKTRERLSEMPQPIIADLMRHGYRLNTVAQVQQIVDDGVDDRGSKTLADGKGAAGVFLPRSNTIVVAETSRTVSSVNPAGPVQGAKPVSSFKPNVMNSMILGHEIGHAEESLLAQYMGGQRPSVSPAWVEAFNADYVAARARFVADHQNDPGARAKFPGEHGLAYYLAPTKAGSYDVPREEAFAAVFWAMYGPAGDEGFRQEILQSFPSCVANMEQLIGSRYPGLAPKHRLAAAPAREG